MERCFYNPENGRIYDYESKIPGLSLIEKKSLSQLQELESPNMTLIFEDKAIRRREDYFKTEVKEISESEYDHFLDILPPVNFSNSGIAQSFQLSEKYTETIVCMYCSISVNGRERYFSFRNTPMDHISILKHIKDSSCYTNI